MHNLSEFMKTLLQRFTRWFNRTHQRSGTLWEERYKSVIVESGIAARTMAAYIDLESGACGDGFRSGGVSLEQLWRGGGRRAEGQREEGAGGTCQGVHESLRGGIRGGEMEGGFADLSADDGTGAWAGRAAGRRWRQAPVGDDEHRGSAGSGNNGTVLPDLGMAAMLRCRVRYFTDGAVIGSKEFVNEAFAAARERFTAKRKDGARRMRGSGAAAAGVLWSVRDLRVDVN